MQLISRNLHSMETGNQMLRISAAYRHSRPNVVSLLTPKIGPKIRLGCLEPRKLGPDLR